MAEPGLPISAVGGQPVMGIDPSGNAQHIKVDADGGVIVSLVDSSATINLTGDVVVDTLGALNNAVETDPAAASATIPSLLRGLLSRLRGNYETVAASQTDQVMGGSGAAGDYLAGVLIVPATTGASSVSIKDGAGSAITIFVGGGTLADLKPIFVPLGMTSASGAWKITTGANVSAIGIGRFSA